MGTWKFSIKPDSQTGYDAFNKCRERGIIGLGWSTCYKEVQPRNLEEARGLRIQEWGQDAPQIKTLFSDIQPGDHVWLHKGGHYYLCIAGERKLIAREICEDFLSFDLGHAIEARWLVVPHELICGSIQRGVIAPILIQPINLSLYEERMNIFVATQLQNDENWLPTFEVARLRQRLIELSEESVFCILSPDDIEDIVSMKLQTEGWLIIKSTCYRSKPVFEFSMTNRNGEFGLVQVKSGKWPKPLPPSEYADHVRGDTKVFLFSTNPQAYPGELVPGVYCIQRNDLLNWIRENPNLLPLSLKIKLSINMD